MTDGRPSRSPEAPPPEPTDEAGADALDPVTRIVVGALELEGEERRAYLARECGDDPEVRAEVEALLAEDDRGETGFLEVPAPLRIAGFDTTVDSPTDEPRQRAREGADEEDVIPERIGPYRIVDRLGEGGMATVYLAEQDEPVRRRVALKVIRALRQPRIRERFAAECQALARLNHPNVASLYEVGATAESEGGRPYVAMEWIEGEHVTAWCDARQADVATRLELFRGVCAGIGHAHEKGVLHCDLKPSNELVTEVDGRAVAKVIDFGIARALDQPLLGGGETLTGEVFLGSPQYISPEAARRGGRKTLDARSDVYSLGLILYELLTGVLPLDMGDHTFWSFLGELSEREPVPPSERFGSLETERAAKIAAVRGTDPAGLLRELRGDLDAVVCKATALDPADRYGSPSELASDLERHLGYRPVAARGTSTAYVASRFARRHLGVAAAGALLVLALGGGFVARTIEARRASAEAARARAELAESERERELMAGLFEAADPDGGDGESRARVEDRLREAVARWEAAYGGQHRLPLLARRRLVGELLRAHRWREAVTEARAVAAATEGRGDPVERTAALRLQAEAERLGGEIAASFDTVRRAVALAEARLGPEDLETLASLDALAATHLAAGETGEAQALLERIARIQDRALAADHPARLRTERALGDAALTAGRPADAEAHYLRLVGARSRLLGPEHGSTAAALHGLARSVAAQGRNDEAAALLTRALAIRRTVYGPNHPSVADSAHELALLERRRGDPARARELLEEAVAIRSAAYPPDDSDLRASRALYEGGFPIPPPPQERGPAGTPSPESEPSAPHTRP